MHLSILSLGGVIMSAHMDEVNVSHSALPSTSGLDTNEPSCIDIEVDVELSPIHSLAPPPSFPTSPFPSRVSTDMEGFDGENSVSAQLSPLLAFTPSENSVHHRINWPRVIKVLVGVTLTILIGLLATLYLIIQRRKTNLECKYNFTVSKDGKSNFTTVSEAVKASPSYSPDKVCIFIRMGEYNEMVKIGYEKINLVLMGEGIGKTTISSNASIEKPITTWPLATLRIYGKKFLAQDLAIINTAHYGVAVENWAENSVLFRCKLESTVNATLHVKAKGQFYRSCHLYGKNHLVFGWAHVFFQKCEFFSEKSYPQEKIVFTSQSSPLSTYKSMFFFHLCAFHVDDKFLNSSETTFLGGSVGDASIVVMQSYLDASIAGYFLGTPSSTTYYAVFHNIRHGGTMKNIPPFIHTLVDVEDASEFSLRVFLGGYNWIPPGVDYDLDLTR